MPYCSMHMPTGLEGLSIPTDGCLCPCPLSLLILSLGVLNHICESPVQPPKLSISNDNGHGHKTPISGNAQTSEHVHRTS